MRTNCWWWCVVCVYLMATFPNLGELTAQQTDQKPADNKNADNNPVTQMAPGVYFMQVQTQPEFLGCNSGWVIFEDYVLVIDAGFPLSARLVVNAVRKTTDKPIRFVFDTHYHGDHSFGNSVYGDLGATAVAHRSCIRDQRVKNPVNWERQAASTNELDRRQLANARPKEATLAFDEKLVFDDGRQRVELLHFGHAHTPGDAVAYLPHHKILFTGDACVNGPFNYTGDSDTISWIAVLSALQQLRVEKIGPGHGPIAGPDLLAKQKRYFEELRQQVAKGIAVGKSPAQIRDGLSIPFYEAWTGVKPETRMENIIHVHNELLGITPTYYLTRDLGLREAAAPITTPNHPPKVVLVPNYAPSKMAMLKAVAPLVRIVPYRTPGEALNLVKDADAVLGTCSPELVKAGNKLRWIQVGSAGVEEYVTIPALRDGPIVLTNTQRIFGPQLADHAFALLLGLTRGLRASLPYQVEAAKWGMPGRSENALSELRGKTILVVGLGGIGTEVARRAQAFGARVVAVDPKVVERPAYVFQLSHPDALLELTARADAVINCAPLTPKTTRMFNAAFFAAMKPTGYFISVGRGKSTDTEALLEALRTRRIAGAGLDVTDPEPLPDNHPLWRLDNAIVTPHVASRSDQREERVFEVYRENLRRFANGEPLLGVVDKTKGY